MSLTCRNILASVDHKYLFPTVFLLFDDVCVDWRISQKKEGMLIMHKFVYVYELTITVGGDTDIPASTASADRELQW